MRSIGSALGLILPAVAVWADPSHAGFRVEQFATQTLGGRAQTLVCAVWYPTQAEETRHVYNTPWIIGRVAVEAPPDAEHGPYPLILYSHGYSGGGISAAFFTEHLARNGFVVVAPDHSDNQQAVRTRGPRNVSLSYLTDAVTLARSGETFDWEAYAYRPHEARAAIDGALALSAKPAGPLAGLVDPERVGAVGHSFGSYTVLSLAGLQPKWKDDRLDAVLAFSGGIFMWKPEDWGRLALPVMIPYGQKEWEERRRIGVTDVATLTHRAYDLCAPPKFMLELKDAGHMTFCQAVVRSLEPSQATGVAAEQVRAINQRGLAFLQRYVKGDESAQAELRRADPMWVLSKSEFE